MSSALNGMRFRSSPHVELKQLGELAAGEREAFTDLESDAEFYGLLVARPPLTMNLKSVARQTAELFQSLAMPSPLDEAILAEPESIEDVIDLVLDGILEIESVDGFISGGDALAVVCPSGDIPELHNAAARLSREALLHAQDLETSDPHTLSMALYRYNHIPLTPFWKTRFANREAILAHLGADRGPLHLLLDRGWLASQRTDGSGWLSWSSTTPWPRTADDVTYKLYVSPRPERIRDAFEIVVRVLADFPGTPFKIGENAAGLLRPDKLVTYFPTREQLGEAAERLGHELEGCEAHGVPFTAGFDDSGLLSWGVDPPENDRALQWQGRESWRLWLVQRLGAALSIAKTARSGAAVEPWRFAIERARRHGVDVETWTPSATLWSRP
jgi:hypothetical protein